MVLLTGTIRSDCVFKVGDFRYGDLAAMLPMADEIAVVSCKGSVLLAALENAVSQIPKTEGRFLQVAGIRFEFDSSKPAGSRVIRETVKVAPRGSSLQSSDGQAGLGRFEPLDENAEYTVATKSYVLQGKRPWGTALELQALKRYPHSPLLHGSSMILPSAGKELPLCGVVVMSSVYVVTMPFCACRS